MRIYILLIHCRKTGPNLRIRTKPLVPLLKAASEDRVVLAIQRG
ncbi:MAG: hypothetical protein ACLTDV_02645 [Eubacterium sp.]